MSETLLERIQRQKKELKAKTGGERPTKLTGVNNVVRILPNWAGDEAGDFSQEFGQHYIKDAAGNVKAVYICMRNTFGEACDVCEARATLGMTATANDELKILDEAKPSNRILVNAIVGGVTAKGQCDLLELPPTVMADILTLWERAFVDDEVNIFDLKTGHNINIEKTGTGRDTRYTVGLALKPTAVPASTMQTARNLKEYAHQEYPQGLAKALTALKAGASLSAAALSGPGGAPALAPPDLSNVDASVLAENDVFENNLDDIDVEEVETAPPPAKAKAAKAAPAPEVEDGPDDALLSELDDLLDNVA